ncbi:DUF5706 domain-containing protein [Wukongibacter baidiensis]|uniref:Pycsar system effector family protein n=1 Tax=Wukongibacter baidiensis TaxID=1723361 RepID=UPI003D7F43A8
MDNNYQIEFMKESHQIEFMKESYQNVNNWLVYAETKNAALLAFNVTTIAAVTRFQFFFINYILLIFYVIAIVSPLISFLPKFRVFMKNQNEITLDKDNLLFYKDISKYSPENYIRKIDSRYQLNIEMIDDKYPNIIFDYAQEIVTNAKIAVWKYAVFRVGLVSSIFCILLTIISRMECI